MAELEPKQQRFVDEYMVDQNATKAAIRSGYSERSAAVIANQLMAKPHVAAAIQKRMADIAEMAGLKAVDLLRETRRVAMSDIADFYDAEGRMLAVRDIPIEARRAIASIEEDVIWEGAGRDRTAVGITRKIKLFDKVKAIELGGKFFKLWTDKIEVDGIVDLADKIKKARERAKKARQHSDA